MSKTFIIPWGSEHICHWCKTNWRECSLFVEDKEIKAILNGTPFMIRPTQLMMLAQIDSCLINKFEPDKDKLPKQFKGRTYIQRSEIKNGKLKRR